MLDILLLYKKNIIKQEKEIQKIRPKFIINKKEL